MTPARATPESMLSYRPWRGTLGGPWHGAWAVARLGLAGLVRRKLVWVLFAFCAMIFLAFFFGQYLFIWAGGQLGESEVRVAGFNRVNPNVLMKELRDNLKLNGSAETFRNIIDGESAILMVTLALVGAQLVGNDFRYRSLPFYLSKPLTARHYVAGKCLAVAAIVLAMTMVPALLLYVEYGLLDSWGYFWDARWLLAGIIGYGLLLAGFLSVLLVAVTSWVQKTVALIMVWMGMFIMAPAVCEILSSVLQLQSAKLFDLWSCTYVVGNAMLGLTLEKHPPVAACAAVLALVTAVSLLALTRRVKAVEVV